MILMTAANRTNGSEIVKQLFGKDAAVRAMVRTPRDPAEDALFGVEFVTADFDKSETIQRAMEGVDRAFLVTNS
jgi:uncharacterized protein YbjT (DUF2867 family)